MALLCIFSWAISNFTSDPVRLVRVVLINEDVTPMSMKYSPSPPATAYRIGLHNTADEILLRASGVGRGGPWPSKLLLPGLFVELAKQILLLPPPTESGHGKISPTTPPPPPNVVVFWGSRKMSATTPPPSHPHRIRLASGDHGQFLLLPPPPPNLVGCWRSRRRCYAGAPSMYRGSGNQMKIVPSYIVHALVTSLYTTYIFRGFVKKVLPQ